MNGERARSRPSRYLRRGRGADHPLPVHAEGDAKGANQADLRARIRQDLRDEDPTAYVWSDTVIDRHLQATQEELPGVWPRRARLTKTASATTHDRPPRCASWRMPPRPAPALRCSRDATIRDDLRRREERRTAGDGAAHGGT